MTQTDPLPNDELAAETMRRFSALVDSVGVKVFASGLGLSTRQVNRMLSGAQPNPVDRLVRALSTATPEVGDRVLDYVCQEMGGHFVRHEAVDDAAVNAVKECAEAIAAISDGEVTSIDMDEIREAISALSGLILAIRRDDDLPPTP